jgi:hypothetical protein
MKEGEVSILEQSGLDESRNELIASQHEIIGYEQDVSDENISIHVDG